MDGNLLFHQWLKASKSQEDDYMTEQFVIDLGVDTLWLAIKLAGPALFAAMAVGLIVSIIQAAT